MSQLLWIPLKTKLCWYSASINWTLNCSTSWRRWRKDTIPVSPAASSSQANPAAGTGCHQPADPYSAFAGTTRRYGEWLRYQLQLQCPGLGWEETPALPETVLRRLQNHDFPDNLRELESLVEQAG